MTLNRLFFFGFLLMYHFIGAQITPLINLDEVTITDLQLKKYPSSQIITVFQDSTISKSSNSLTSLLNNNSVIYFKENGLGMVSSPSFRGTTAQQTAVVWNGININSQLLGLTDFNLINTRDYNSIAIRPGGGSVIYGTGAIGGSIHLNNQLNFSKTTQTNFFSEYGSFNTLFVTGKINTNTEKQSVEVIISKNSSDNDYKYLRTNQTNENGAFDKMSVSANFGYKLNSTNQIALFSQLFKSNREFSGTLFATSQSKYIDLNARNLLEWTSVLNKFVSKLRVAYLSEQYQYFSNKNIDYYSGNTAQTSIIKYDGLYQFNSKFYVNGIVDYTYTNAFGTSILGNDRATKSGSLLLHYTVNKWLLFDANVRNEYTSIYKSPVLFSISTRLKLSNLYSLSLSASRNYRVPTFNELYYYPNGNINLKPENSYQFEVRNSLTLKNININVTAFYNSILDMISWVQDSTNLYRPINTNEVKTYGLESIINANHKIGEHNFSVFGSHGYTVSKNNETKKQLIFVPYQKATFSFSYNYKKIGFDYQWVYTGRVFTSLDNYYKLKSYDVSNLNFYCDMNKKKTYRVSFRVLNFLNEEYQNTETRPMPGRNYSMNFTIKF